MIDAISGGYRDGWATSPNIKGYYVAHRLLVFVTHNASSRMGGG